MHAIPSTHLVRIARQRAVGLSACLALMVACGPLASSAPPGSGSTPTPAPVRIGISAALTGPNAAVYAAVYESISVYFQRANAMGSLGSSRVELVVEDDG